MAEQADGYGSKKYLRKIKAREERRKAKKKLKDGEEPIDSYGKYKGWQS